MLQKCDITEPSNIQDAVSQPLCAAAMDSEIQALHKNHTWDLVPLPLGKKAIGCKWVFRVKLKFDGRLDKCKARLVAKGYNQRIGMDYEETFSLVIKMGTVRILLSLAASNHWSLHQLDVNNAFLHGNLKDEVYMLMPDGIPNPHNLVCLLRKSLYGLKQASGEWHAKLVEELIHLDFVQSKNDYSLFIKKTNGKMCIAAVYVDDVILTGDDEVAIQELKPIWMIYLESRTWVTCTIFSGLKSSVLTMVLFCHNRSLRGRFFKNMGLIYSRNLALLYLCISNYA